MPTACAASGFSPQASTRSPALVLNRNQCVSGTSRNATGSRTFIPRPMVGRRSTGGELPACPQVCSVRNDVSPSPSRTIAVPATIWSALSVTVQKAKTRPPTAPATMATTRPMIGLLKNQVPATAANAPISMNPSSAILVIPERSERSPPIAAKTSGAAERSVAVSSATEKNESNSSRVRLLPSNRTRRRRRLNQRIAGVLRRAVACHATRSGCQPLCLAELLHHRQRRYGQDDECKEDIDDIPRDASRVLHLRRPGGQRSEEQPGQDDAERGVAPDEANRDRGETDPEGDVVVATLQTKRVNRAAEAGEQSTEEHGQRDRPPPGDSRERGGAGAQPDGADLVAEDGAIEQEPDDNRRCEGNQYAGMQPGSFDEAR